jgi:hypothetical protein
MATHQYDFVLNNGLRQCKLVKCHCHQQKQTHRFITILLEFVSDLMCTSATKNSVARTMTTMTRVKAYSYSYLDLFYHIR